MTTPTEVPSPDDAAMLARRLREAREFVNVSQQFVAEQTGIPRTAISDIERGSRRVDSLELKRLATVYRMPVDYFLGYGEEKIGGGETTLRCALWHGLPPRCLRPRRRRFCASRCFFRTISGRPGGLGDHMGRRSSQRRSPRRAIPRRP